MTIYINGTTGISGVDGSAATPALQGTDTNTGISFGSDVIIASTGGTERWRTDASGRVLVGTSSASSLNASGLEVYRNGIVDGDGGGNALLLRKNEFNAGSQTATMFRVQSGTSTQAQLAVGLFTDSTGVTGSFFDQVNGGCGLTFRTGGTERMRVTQAGKVRINNTGGFNNGEWLIVAGDGLNTAASFYQPTANNVAQIYFGNANGNVGSIFTNGSATAFNTSSDYRLKENVVPLTGAIDRVNQLQVHRFNFIADPDKTVDGFIAHEAQEIVPECVTGVKDEVDTDGNPVYQGIDQSKLVPLLTAALKEALAEIESLKARVTALEP